MVFTISLVLKSRVGDLKESKQKNWELNIPKLQKAKELCLLDNMRKVPRTTHWVFDGF